MNENLMKLADKLPTGRKDQKALEKYERELDELRSEIFNGDRVGSLLEAADCYYYICKAHATRLITQHEAQSNLAHVCELSGFTRIQITCAAFEKYSLRARPGNPKNDDEERESVKHLI